MTSPAPADHLPRIAEIIGERANLAPEHIQPAHDLFDLGIEGLELAAVVTDIQAEYGIAISDYEHDRLIFVRDILGLLDRKGAQVRPARQPRLDEVAR
jgi:acyl carrier protein